MAKKMVKSRGKRMSEGGRAEMEDRDDDREMPMRRMGEPDEMPGRRMRKRDEMRGRRMDGMRRERPMPPKTNYPEVEGPGKPILGGAAPGFGGSVPARPAAPGVMPPLGQVKPAPMPMPANPMPGRPTPGNELPKVNRPAVMPPVAGMQRMKKGGLVKGCGCASRGVKKAKYS